MNIAEALAKTEVKGRVLLVGSPAEAVAAAERLGLSEVFIADTDHQALENTAKTHTSLKINPVYTRVVERWVEL
ncbi:MAG: hypothetical protein NZ570_02370, partial [Candidatus Caldarchaeum sp.]|nr:hypothetical protein [Candidatus Caldarchaeum sp.]